MPRFPAVDPATATGRAKEVFDGPLKGKHLNIFKHMAAAPAMLDAYLGLAGALSKSSLSHKEQEAIHLAISQANDCDYCLAAHTAIGKMAGLSEPQTVEARKGHLADARLNALVRFSLALHEKHGGISDADLNAFKSAGYSDQQALEVIVTQTLATMTNYFNRANDTPVDFPAPPAI
ncbi:MAG: carboxymuconolactone decarboxylase family protein [Phycisphaeraceae bacterium]|nr:carboxymuconolactone decarboxylase family protein [Phycisphaeraceae bacterium]